MNVFKAIFFLSLDLLCFLTGEGSWTFRSHERIVLDAAIDSFSEDMRRLFRAQLEQKVFIQRSNKRISLVRFYSSLYFPDKSRQKVEGHESSHEIVNVQIDIDGKKEIAQVEFFGGYIFSIQFKQPSRFYANKLVKVLGVKLGSPSLSHAAAIDRREHGKRH